MMSCRCPLAWDGSSRDPKPDPKYPDNECPIHGALASSDAPEPMALRVCDEGSLVLLQPVDDAARAWLAENLDPDGHMFGTAHVVEPRYVAPILEGFQSDGGIIR